jgi:ankyrin repeat protein
LAAGGADMNAYNNEEWTPLHLAVKRGSFDATEALINLNNEEYIAEEVNLDC